VTRATRWQTYYLALAAGGSALTWHLPVSWANAGCVLVQDLQVDVAVEDGIQLLDALLSDQKQLSGSEITRSLKTADPLETNKIWCPPFASLLCQIRQAQRHPRWPCRGSELLPFQSCSTFHSARQQFNELKHYISRHILCAEFCIKAKRDAHYISCRAPPSTRPAGSTRPALHEVITSARAVV
jgi:hypothetical protein